MIQKLRVEALESSITLNANKRCSRVTSISWRILIWERGDCDGSCVLAWRQQARLWRRTRMLSWIHCIRIHFGARTVRAIVGFKNFYATNENQMYALLVAEIGKIRNFITLCTNSNDIEWENVIFLVVCNRVEREFYQRIFSGFTGK